MTHNEAIKMARDALIEIKRTPHHPDYDTYTYDHACEALVALDSLAENVIMTAGVPETGVVHFIIRFDESGNEYIHNFGTMKWEPLAVEPSEPTCRYPFYDVDNQTLQWTDTQGNVWERKFINGVWKDAWIVEEEASDLDGKVFTRPDPELIGQAITARDERIIREYDEKITKLNRIIDGCISVLHGPSRLHETAQLVEKERAAIMGGKE